MGEWTAVKLTGARQVGELMGMEAAALPDGELAAPDHYAALRAADSNDEALGFIGHALPRLEVVSWAARILDEESRGRTLDSADKQALDRSLRWLDDPSDGARRDAYDAALDAGERAPERLLGFAVFFSGGSMSLVDLPPVLPPPEACARCATGAVMLAAHRSGDPKGLVARALKLAESVAERGTRALHPA